MASGSADPEFFVWGIDQTAYGPVELPALVSWVRDERVTPETWIFATKSEAWQRAAEVPELQMFFRPKSGGAAAATMGAEAPTGVDSRVLRRVKILAGMSEEQLERFAQFMQIEKVPQWAVIVKQVEPGDTMYLILQGDLRRRMNVMGK